MPDPEVKLKFFGDTEELERAVVRMEKQLDRLKEKNRAAGKSGRFAQQNANLMAKHMGGAASSADSMFKSMVGLGAVIGAARGGLRLLQDQFDDMKQRQQKAATAQLGIAGSLRAGFLNVGDDKVMTTPESFKQAVLRVSKERGQLPLQVSDVMGQAMSARGNLPASAAETATSTAMQAFPNLLESQTFIAQSVLDLKKGSAADVSAEDIVGFLVALQKTQRVTTVAELGENIAPTIAAIRDTGEADARDAGAIAATIGQSMFDPQGRRTGTAGIALALALREGKGLNKFKGFKELDNTIDKIEFVQNTPGAMESFLDKNTFQKKAELPIEMLLTKGSAAAENLKGARAALPVLTEGDAVFRKKVSELESDPTQILDAQKRATESFAARQFLKNNRAAKSAVARKGLDETLESLDTPKVFRQAAGLGFEALGGGPDAQIAILEERLNAAERGRSDLWSAMFQSRRRHGGPSAKDEETAEDLRALIKVLKDNKDLAEESNRIARDNGDKAEKLKLNRNANGEN